MSEKRLMHFEYFLQKERKHSTYLSDKFKSRNAFTTQNSFENTNTLTTLSTRLSTSTGTQTAVIRPLTTANSLIPSTI